MERVDNPFPALGRFSCGCGADEFRIKQAGKSDTAQAISRPTEESTAVDV
jgi:hypothetical protein